MKFNIQELNSVNNPNSIHGIYPYRGKISSIDAEQIISQMPKESVLLDPFCGSGTIVYEGTRFGLHTIGVDANPIAVLLSKGKINIPQKYLEVKEEVIALVAEADKIEGFKKFPEYSNSLFHKDSLNEILKVSSLIDKMSDYVKACFLGTICLTARGCNQYKWTSSTVGKNIEPKRYIPFYEKWLQKTKKHFYPVLNDSKVYFHDSRKLTDILKPESIDFVFSSPPYFDCLDYTSYYAKIIYEILNINRLDIKSSLIQEYSVYEKNMKKVLDNLFPLMKKGGQLIFVVGDKKIHGKVLNGAEFFQKISPFKHVEIIERTYSGSSSQVFDKLNNTLRKEQIIIWEK
jgi:methylase of polypeptide subunit release factors